MSAPAQQTDPKTPLDYERTQPVRAWSSRKLIVGLLLLAGVEMWLMFAGRSGAYWGRNSQIGMILLIAAVACVLPVSRAFTRLIDRLARSSRPSLNVAAICIGIVAPIYIYFDARYQHRSFTPKYHDEFSYIIQTRMIAHGRLWEPAHPRAEFFDSFQLIAEPVYASIYFPGTALMYTPGVWLGLPSWVMPLVLSGAVVGLLFRVVSELIDPVFGFLAALMLVANEIFRMQALKPMSELPAMLLTLTMFFAWLRWREKRSIGWAIALGISFGWCAITRPLDALIFAIPIGIAVIASRPVLRTVVAIVLAVLPFVALQAVFNRAVTGSVFHTPFNYYANKYFPQTSFGFHRFDASVRPQSELPQKQAYYDQLALPQIRAHTPQQMLTNWSDSRFRNAIIKNVPTWLTMILIPAGLVAIFADRRRLMLWLTLPLFVILYFFYTFFLAHYPLIVAAAVVLNLVGGAHVVANTWPRARPILLTFLTLALAALSVSEFAEFNRVQRDEWFEGEQLQQIDKTLANLDHKPALVLFRFGGSANPEEEPVYNIDVMYPDDAEVIRAHDLGDARNVELFEYYAKRRPDLFAYRYDRADDSLRYLGRVRDLIIRKP